MKTIPRNEKAKDNTSINQTLEEIRIEFSNKLFLKVITKKQIIGSVRGYQKGETCHINRLIVHPNYQNRGIGTKLIKKIESPFKDATRFQLDTGHKSRKNLYLYQKLGYVIFKTEEKNDKLKLVYLQKFKTDGEHPETRVF